MRFTATTLATLLFGASALAAPASSSQHAARQDDDPMSEDVSITGFAVHKAGANGTSPGVVDGVGFVLSGEDATDLSCSATATQVTSGLPTDVITCGDSKYRFALLAGPDSSTFTLRVYHELGLAVGFYGAGDVPTYCHSGGLDNVVCSQVQTPVTIRIDSLPDEA
ncbi:hypothetical protein F4820DRAFT_452472 [Hypoxylon rubiginosum]|uniref:Uncharacterized protein n=1 Tax=Hypoxylon rubiginosum TaxID=110542 RepID=A0ACB9YP17_9PEZI|nr:hypothetical protein F4820DRAFT_452472 [Hypoxylon rubiginosum]